MGNFATKPRGPMDDLMANTDINKVSKFQSRLYNDIPDFDLKEYAYNRDYFKELEDAI